MKILKVTGMVFLALVMVSMFAVQVMAERPGGFWGSSRQDRPFHDQQRDGQRRGHHMRDLIDELGLTEEQQEALRANREENMAKTRELMRAFRKKKSELRQVLDRYGSTEAEIRVVSDEVQALSAQAQDQRIEGILKIKSILNEEQYTKFQEQIAKKHRRREKGPRGRGNRHMDRHDQGLQGPPPPQDEGQ